jgi:exonuclease SbcC
MITKLKLKNFQKHKDMTIELDRGVNAIVGQSDAGKSAVIRALNHALMNPTGDYTTHGEDEFRVGVWLDGKVIVRTKSKSENSYRMDKDLFESVGKTIPKEIADHIKLSPLNFQNQFDPPYMLSESGGACAREINSLSRLDMIDTLNQYFSKECRDNNKRLIESCEEMETVKKKKSIVDNWTAMPSVDLLTQQWKALEAEQSRLESIRKAAHTWQTLNNKATPPTETLVDALEAAKELSMGIDTLKAKHASALKYEQAKQRLVNVSLPLDISEIGAMIETVTATQKQLDSVLKARAKLSMSIILSEEIERELVTLQEQFDGIEQCPLCGGKL